MEIPEKLKIETPFDSAYLNWVYSLKEFKTSHYSDTRTPMFTAVQFTVPKLLKQSRNSSIDEQINKIGMYRK